MSCWYFPWRTHLEVRGRGSLDDVIHMGREGKGVDLEGKMENDQQTLDSLPPLTFCLICQHIYPQEVDLGSRKNGGKVVLTPTSWAASSPSHHSPTSIPQPYRFSLNK